MLKPPYGTIHIMIEYPDSEIYKKVFHGFPALSTLNAYTTDSAIKKEQRVKFESNEVRNPGLTTNITMDFKELNLLNKERVSIANKIQKDYKDLYIYALEKQQLTADMILASSTRNWEQFINVNRTFYGDYDTDIWNYSLYRLEKLLKERKGISKYEKSIKYLGENINIKYDKKKALDIESIINKPLSIETITEIKSITKREINIPAGEKFNSEEMRKIFSNALIEYNIDEKWQVEIHPDYEGFTIDPSTKRVYIPNNKEYSSARVQRLIPHEIGVHVQRKQNNDRNATLRILKRNCFSNTSEEGLATLVETVLNLNKPDQYISFMSIGLVLGLDGTKRDFRDLYELLINIYYLKDDDYKTDDAWTSCIKTFLGTDYNTKGVCYFRRKGYLQDYIYTKKYLLQNPDSVKDIFKFKYDYLNKTVSKAFQRYL